MNKLEFDLISTLVIVLGNVGFYWETLSFGTVTDDVEHMEYMKTGSEAHWKALFSSRDPRSFFLHLSRLFYGGGTFGTDNLKLDHTITLGLHTLTCCLIFFALGSTELSLMVALLYSFHPSNHQTSIWLNGRRYSVATILILLMMLLGTYGIPLYFLTGIFHITGLFAPILIAKENPWVLLAIPLYVLLGMKKCIEQYNERKKCIFDKDQVYFYPRRLFIVVKCYGFSFFRMLGWGETLMLYPILQNWGITKKGNANAYAMNLDFWKGILALVGSVVGVVLIQGQDKYYWIFMCLGVLQWCAIIPAVQLNTDRYTSITNIFMMYFLVKLFGPWPWNFVFLGLISCTYMGKTRELFPMYRDLISFYDYHIEKHPELTCTLGAKIVELIKLKKTAEAWDLVLQGLSHNPNDYSLLLLAAVISVMGGQRNLAFIYLNRADQNYYTGKEEFEKEEIANLRAQVSKLPDTPGQLKGWTV